MESDPSGSKLDKRAVTYLENAWYAAAFDNEVSDTPIRRMLLGKDVVLFRGETGEPAALSDRCPHRLAPLSAGRVEGSTIECGYHGLRFDRSGACVFNPHGTGAIPGALRIHAYPVAQRYGVIWFWPGDVSKADEALIPTAFCFIESPEFADVRGYLNVKANYQLVADNLLDLSHVPYIHPQFGVKGVPAAERIKQLKQGFVRDGEKVSALHSREDVPPNDISKARFGVTAERVDTRQNMHWLPPSNLFFDLGFTERTEARRDYALPAAHLITPETEFTSHYFFIQGRNAAIQNDDVGQAQLADTVYAFAQQDKPIVEAQQAGLGPTADLMSAGPVLFGIDAAPMAARKILSGLIAKEQQHGAGS